jgi:tetratricopeptide (TPR) repeat protein
VQPPPPVEAERSRTVSPVLPIGLAATVAAGVLALVLLLGGGDRGGTARQTASRTTAAPPSETKAAASTAPAAPSDSTQAGRSDQPAGSTSAEAPSDPATLNTRGYALSQGGNYADAIPLLQASVDGYRKADQTKGLDYAYALFNLAVALTRSGSPAEAVPLLEERLTYDNQRGAVRKALKEAQAQLAGANQPKSAARTKRDER